MSENNKPLRSGYTTGSCATAATAAALELLVNNVKSESIDLILPNGDTATIKVESLTRHNLSATASVKKDAGDDPDITHGAIISSTVRLNNSGNILFVAGEGVGTITKDGLQIPKGEAAINPVPRQMMETVTKKFTPSGVTITIEVQNGRKLAEKTFNPRLGIIGGISIIGTSGIVRPFSHKAIQDTVKVNIDVATATGQTRLALVAGHYGMKAINTYFHIANDEIIEVSNAWGTALNHARTKGVKSLLILSHPGKLAKFIDGHFNTHSSFSPSALPIVKRIASTLQIKISDDSTTVDGIFKELPPEKSSILGNELALQIHKAAKAESNITDIQIILIDMKHNKLGSAGDSNTWLPNK